jgi:hypothetical protein
VNAAPRALVSSFLSNGTVGPGEADHVPPPSDLVDAYLARCALVGIFPWAHSGNVVPADAYDLAEKMRPWYKLFALRGASDLSTMQFLPYHRETAAVTDTPYVRAATYWNRDEAIVVVANSESSEAHGFRLTILPERFGWPQGAKVTLAPSRYCAPLQPGGRPNTFGGRLHGFGFAAYHVRR